MAAEVWRESDEGRQGKSQEGTGSDTDHMRKQFCGGPDAVFRVRDFGHLQRAVRLQPSAAGYFPGNLDLPVPGIVGVHSVWGEKKHPHSLAVQLCGGLSVRDCRGRPRVLDRYSADGSVLENFVFCRQLPPALRGSRHRKQEPDAPGAHGSVSQGIFCFDREAVFQGEDLF